MDWDGSRVRRDEAADESLTGPFQARDPTAL